jgi:hypothetical protein
MGMTAYAPPYTVPPLAELLAKADASAHPLMSSVYAAMEANKSLGMPRSDAMAIGGWGDSYQRRLEADGTLPTWVDGSFVRVWTPAVYLRVIDNIIGSYPAGEGGVRKAVRMPPHKFPRGYHRSKPRTAAELDALKRANARRAEEAQAHRAGEDAENTT